MGQKRGFLGNEANQVILNKNKLMLYNWLYRVFLEKVA
ncbi:hypothetical protein URS_2064 [Acinetobacter ursingii]|nr:hypothetical protein URS_2064 [Acinetobacter ursingii]